MEPNWNHCLKNCGIDSRAGIGSNVESIPGLESVNKAGMGSMWPQYSNKYNLSYICPFSRQKFEYLTDYWYMWLDHKDNLLRNQSLANSFAF